MSSISDSGSPLRIAWDALQELYQLCEAEDLDRANEAVGGFADLYDSGRIPEYRDILDTISATSNRYH